VMRVMEGHNLDETYLQSLSSDAVPVFIELYFQEDLPQEAEHKLGIELACRTAMMEDREEMPWQSFHLSENNAHIWLQAYKGYWQQNYTVFQNDDHGRWWIRIRGGEEKPCRYDFWEYF